MNNSCINSRHDALTERRQEDGEQRGAARALVHIDINVSTTVLAEEENTSSSSSCYFRGKEAVLLLLQLTCSGSNHKGFVPLTKISLLFTRMASIEKFGDSGYSGRNVFCHIFMK